MRAIFCTIAQGGRLLSPRSLLGCELVRDYDVCFESPCAGLLAERLSLVLAASLVFNHTRIHTLELVGTPNYTGELSILDTPSAKMVLWMALSPIRASRDDLSFGRNSCQSHRCVFLTSRKMNSTSNLSNSSGVPSG